MDDKIEAPAPEGKKGFSPAGNLGKMVGPLPLWGWGAAILIGVAIIMIRRRKSGAVDDSGGATYAQQAQIPTVGNTAGGGSSPVITGGDSAITTNTEWRTRAVRHLLGRGYGSLDADTAIGRYLRSDSLTSQQRALVDEALAALGVPPQPPAPSPNAPDTETPPAGPGPVGGPGTVDTPHTAYQGAYFGFAGDHVAFSPNDPELGRYGVWQTGTYTPAPAGWRDYAIGTLRSHGVAAGE